jgi:uncharacterized protein (TIGR02118 family)
MIKLVFSLRRKPGMSHEEFQRYWREDHAALVQSHQEVLGIRRYVQVHADHGPVTEALTGSRGAPEPYDGVAELWYDSREALANRGKDPDARAAGKELFEDEQKFIDHATSPIWIGEENVVIGE